MRRYLFVPLALLTVCGCALPRQDNAGAYRTVARDPRRDTSAARDEAAKGRALMAAGDLAGAEKAFKAALTKDLFHGPAHNSLGVVYYRQKKFYLAAWEFQYAAELMAHRPEPRNNLGLVFEDVGKLDKAVTHYTEALKLEPDNPVFIGNLARCRVRRGQRDGETRKLLEDLILKDTRPEWVAWARTELLGMAPAEGRAPTTQPASGLRPPVGPRSP